MTRSTLALAVARPAICKLVLASALLAVALLLTNRARAVEPGQYEYENVHVAAATVDEPMLPELSVARAVDYLEKGAYAWTKENECISCHTNGTYLAVRTELTSEIGPPSLDMRDFFVAELKRLEAEDVDELKKGITPTQIAYLANGLAAWDAHVFQGLSAETTSALSLMFQVQSDDGSQGNTECWPPYESSSYHGATVAAMAAATAPGYVCDFLPRSDPATRARFQKLLCYLSTTEPPHDYARLLKLWTSTRIPCLLSDAAQHQIIAEVYQRQRPDGGWSIRSFATPEQWGSGNRAAKLRAEADFANPASDGHQTGLCIAVLRDAGVPASDPRIERGVRWLERNQRESGRWWTRSLNTDGPHFITYSGTCFPLLALAKTKRLGPLPTRQIAVGPLPDDYGGEPVARKTTRRCAFVADSTETLKSIDLHGLVVTNGKSK